MTDLEGLGENVKDLTHASKATINEFHKYYLIHGMVYPKDANRTDLLIRKLNPADYGLDDAQLEKIDKWEAKVKATANIQATQNYNNPHLSDHYIERLGRYLALYK